MHRLICCVIVVESVFLSNQNQYLLAIPATKILILVKFYISASSARRLKDHTNINYKSSKPSLGKLLNWQTLIRII